MTWDYIQDDHEAPFVHRYSRGKWETIDIELMMQTRIVRLTKPEWKELKLFLERYDFSEIKPEFYQDLSPKVVRVIRDWLDYNAQCASSSSTSSA